MPHCRQVLSRYESCPSHTFPSYPWSIQCNAQDAKISGLQKWNAEKGFGFIGRSVGNDCFVHKRECGGNDLSVGQAVSFVFEEDPKGGTAKQVREEEGGEPVIDEDDGERELGKVQSYNEEKGFAFIVRIESRAEMGVPANLLPPAAMHGGR